MGGASVVVTGQRVIEGGLQIIRAVVRPNNLLPQLYGLSATLIGVACGLNAAFFWPTYAIATAYAWLVLNRLKLV